MTRNIIFASTVFLLLAEPACSPVEEGHSTRLTCEFNTSTCPETNLALQWIANNKEAAQCTKQYCGGRYFRQNHFSTTITPTRSELTVNRATRSEGDLFNMETRWECRRCSGTIASVTACDKLQIYGECLGVDTSHCDSLILSKIKEESIAAQWVLKVMSTEA